MLEVCNLFYKQDTSSFDSFCCPNISSIAEPNFTDSNNNDQFEIGHYVNDNGDI